MKSSVIIFPGSNCDRDMDVALKKFGFENQMVWHNDEEIPNYQIITLKNIIDLLKSSQGTIQAFLVGMLAVA